MDEAVEEVVTAVDYSAVLEALLDAVGNLYQDVVGESEDEETSVAENVAVLQTDVAEVKEMVTVAVERPFLTTPIEDYSVSEGLLLMILFVLFLRALLRLVKEGFFWLWS